MSSTAPYSVVVLGGGSAGLIAAVTLKRQVPGIQVRLIYSDKIGIIGVGEGTTAYFPKHFFQHLGLDPRGFFQTAKPTWKLGIRFLWGRRKEFYYSFMTEFDASYPELSLDAGYYYDQGEGWCGIGSACMANEVAFPCLTGSRLPNLNLVHAFHFENHRLVDWLEQAARSLGVEFTEGTLQSVEQDDHGVRALVMEDGTRHEADLFVDASGFRSELLGSALDEPFVDYSDHLFCDRAWVAGWPRTAEDPLHPYTTAETMDSGWCWQIEHEEWVNRGYVFSSGFIEDDQAREEFMRKNPKIEKEPRLVKFRSGRAQRGWVKNVVGLGNASGFVEPLEATALHIICTQAAKIAEILKLMKCSVTQSAANLYNKVNATAWDDTRDFLAVHYAFNDLIDTPFWRHCVEKTDLGNARELVEFYKENGPSTSCRDYLIDSTNSFGLEGYFAMLVGQDVPYTNRMELPSKEIAFWKKHTSFLLEKARGGIGVLDSLHEVRKPSWKWEAFKGRTY